MLLFAYVVVMKRLVEITGWDQAALTRFDTDLKSFLSDGPLVMDVE